MDTSLKRAAGRRARLGFRTTHDVSTSLRITESLVSEKIETVSGRAVAVNFDSKKIDAIFAQLDQCHLPGAVVGIAVDGKPVYRRGVGLSNMEVPVILSPTTRLRIGSITKHFAALAYMLLCEEGKAAIDDPIGQHLPEVHSACRAVTMRQLMGNISGLRDAFDICWVFSGTGGRISSADLLSLYCDIDDVNADPGSAWIYCNGGFLMLSSVIERITDQALEDVLRERIFEPIGMHDTLLRRFDTDFVPNSAALHTKNPTGGFEKAYLGTALAGEGGIVSTVDDMLLWLAHMDAPIVGSGATWALMRMPQRLANGTSTGYGLGLKTGRYRGIETISHGGSVMGGNSEILKVPAIGLDVVILVNRSDVFSTLLVSKVVDACVSGLEPERERSRNSFATGTFQSRKTGRVVQLFASNEQQIVSVSGLDMPFEPDDSGVLWPAGIWRHLKQSVTVVGDPGQPESIRFNDFGNVDELVLVEPVSAADIGPMMGCYRSDSTGTEATIFDGAEGPRLRVMGRFGSAVYRLEPLSAGIWRARLAGAMPWGGVLSFDRDVARFSFSTSRTWGLIFRRVD